MMACFIEQQAHFHAVCRIDDEIHVFDQIIYRTAVDIRDDRVYLDFGIHCLQIFICGNDFRSFFLCIFFGKDGLSLQFGEFDIVSVD